MTGPTARAVVMTGPGEVEVREYPIPEPAAGAVLMRVSLSGICGTDKHTFRGETSQYAGTDHAREVPFPLICGHENVGVVVATGGEVVANDGSPLETGDRIVPGANVACGRCFACEHGLPYYLCERLEDYGNSLSCAVAPHLFGGWAEYLYLLPRSLIFRVPDEVPDHVAVLTEPMAVTHGIDAALATLQARGGARDELSVVVIGQGPLGACHVIKAEAVGATEVIAVDRLPGRLSIAERLGATSTIDASTGTIESRRDLVLARTSGVGADVVVDCSGVASTFPEALYLARPGGVVIEAGAFVQMGTVPIDPSADVCVRDLTILGVGGEREEGYVSSLELMASGGHAFDSVVTDRFTLEDAGRAIEVAQQETSLKVVFEPHP